MDAPYDPATGPRKLNLGCGWDKRDGFLNVDLHEFHDPDLVADVRDLSMLPAGHFDHIVAQDILEHLERTDVDPALEEWSRLLRIGGTLELRLPDVIGLARLLSSRRDLETQRMLLQNMYGTQAYTGDYHHAGFTEITLRTALHEAGMQVVTLTRRDEWMFDCLAEKVTEPGAAVGPVDLGPLPLMELCDHANGSATLGGLDGAVSSIGRHVPDRPRELARRVWRPARKGLVRIGVIS